VRSLFSAVNWPISDTVVSNEAAAGDPKLEPAERYGGGRVARTTVLAAADLLALAVAAAAAYLLYALPVLEQSITVYVGLAPLLLLFIAGYAQAGLYPGFGLGPVETLRRLTYVTAFGFLVLAGFAFALKLPPLYYSRVSFALALVFSVLALPLARALVWLAAGRREWWREPVVVVGTGARAVRAIRSIQASDHLGYRPVGVLAPRPHTAGVAIEGVPVCGGLESAASLAARGIRVALLEIDQSLDPAIVDRLQRHFHHVVLLREFDDLPVEGIQIRNLGGVVGIEYTNNLLIHRNRIVKRALDIVLGIAALVVAAPFIAIAVALVKAIDRGPAFFRQRRSGLDGETITVPKIRTMRVDAEDYLEEQLEANPDLRAEWQNGYKLKRDPRLIPIVGRAFRRFSIDELPQLWTVVIGRMSLVGPRPFPDYHLQQFPPAFLELRRRVRPGLTGLWQVTVRSEGGIEKQQAFDTYYIRNWSVWLDLYVLARTIAAVASGRGAY
jgi:Undecaprenyl-phosphate galactose phosphotransferase WbaP